MSLFDQLQGGPRAPQINPQQMLAQLRANPAAVLQQRGLNIPQGMNNPQAILQHLVQTGQVPNARVQQAMQMLGRR